MAHDLRAAAAALSQWMRSSVVNENTVLAAHLRRLGVQPKGDAWRDAKHYLLQGMSFEEAAQLAAGRGAHAESDLTVDVSCHDEGRRESTVEGGGHAGVSESVPLGDSVRPLDWYPKRFSPGDIDGEGARRLLGTPNIPLASVLVREAAQNSWDARLGDRAVDFIINLRQLSEMQTRTLRDVCFHEAGPVLNVSEALNGPVWVLEISDRGTTGLEGPTRNDLAVGPGVPTNFIDFIFNLGGNHDSPASGGTYGFGKTVSYKVSNLGLILVWSRISTPSGLENRLIGSAISDRFDMHEYRYTGRHWWGRRQEDSIQPLIGDDAEMLGRSVFHRGFLDEETGTSLLILCPELGGASKQDDARLLAEAVRWHLWTKTLEAQPEDVEMRIDVQLEGRSVALVDESQGDPLMVGLGVCLRAVRATQHGAEPPEMLPPVIVQEVWCQRPRVLVGHVALQRYQELDGEPDEDGVVPFGRPAHHVALMRNSAELVVKYLAGRPHPDPGFGWVGVFKPLARWDPLFASAEPPAHDDWVPEGADASTHPRGRTIVRVGLRRIQEVVDEFVQPPPDTNMQVSHDQSVAGIADALADLVPHVAASRPQHRSSHTARSREGKGARVAVRRQELGPSTPDGDRLVALEVEVSGAPDGVALIASGSIAVEGGSDGGGGAVEVVGWADREPDLSLAGADIASGATHELRGSTCWVVLRAKATLAIDVQIDVVS